MSLIYTTICWSPVSPALALSTVNFVGPIACNAERYRRQYLEEDPRTNRIDDSLQLFTTICSNKLLHKAALVLMLNKVSLPLHSLWEAQH